MQERFKEDRNTSTEKEPEIKLSNGGAFARKFDNFWYYNKWKVIIAVIAVFIVTVCTVQMCTRTSTDIGIVYAGNYNMSETDYSEISRVICSVMPKDFNGDGEKSISILRYYIFSEDELKAFNSETDSEGNKINNYPSGNNASQRSDFYDTLSYDSGYQIFFVSRSLFDEIVSNNSKILCPVEEITGELPKEYLTENGLGVRLSETELYGYYDAMKLFPEDTVICIMNQTLMTDNDTYDVAKQMFFALINFTAPE